MSKILIAISSCWNYELGGENSAQRNTWLPEVANFPDLEYKFFIGRGQGAENQLTSGNRIIVWTTIAPNFEEVIMRVEYECQPTDEDRSEADEKCRFVAEQMGMTLTSSELLS